MAPSVSGFTLNDLLGWIQDVQCQTLPKNHDSLTQGFSHPFSRAIAAAIPEVRLYTATAQLYQQHPDGTWSPYVSPAPELHIPRFAGNWLVPAGVATIPRLNEIMQRLLEYNLLCMPRKEARQFPPLRVSGIEFKQYAPPHPLSSKPPGPMDMSKIVQDLLVGHRQRHLQAHALDLATPLPANARPSRRI